MASPAEIGRIDRLQTRMEPRPGLDQRQTSLARDGPRDGFPAAWPCLRGQDREAERAFFDKALIGFDLFFP